jgi:hypothetical protein
MVAAGKARLETVKRFDMSGYRPPAPYLREMARYDILPEWPGPETPVDPYALDRAYWRSFSPEVQVHHEAYQSHAGADRP